MPAHNAAPPQQPARAGPAVAPPWRRGSCPPSEGAHRPGGARGGGKEGQTGLAQKVGSETESAGRVAESTASTRWKRETEKEKEKVYTSAPVVYQAFKIESLGVIVAIALECALFASFIAL